MNEFPSILNTTEYIKSEHGLRNIFTQSFKTSEKESANLIVTHGLGEHSNAYNVFIKELCKNLKIRVTTWDLAGHGKSSGQRGYVGDISWMINDLKQVITKTKSKSTAPIFLLSHSLGGLLTLSLEQTGFLNKKNIQGIVLSNPCTKLNFTPPKWKTTGADILAIFAPRLTLGNEIKPEQLSSDPSYLKEFRTDPMRHSKLSPRLFLGMLKLIKNLTPFDSKIPTITLLSPKDSVCSAKYTEELLKKRSDFVFFDHSLHEVLNDVEKETAQNKIKEFLSEHI